MDKLWLHLPYFLAQIISRNTRTIYDRLIHTIAKVYVFFKLMFIAFYACYKSIPNFKYEKNIVLCLKKSMGFIGPKKKIPTLYPYYFFTVEIWCIDLLMKL
jgi:hypothetical protein